MKKLFNSLINFIEYNYLEYFSYLLLIVWVISPVVEYILKNYLHFGYTTYFEFAIYFIGLSGILEYIIYIIKKIKDKEFDIKKMIPQILIGILLIISIIASIYSNDSYLSFFGEGYRKEGLIVYIMYIGYILAASIIKNKKYVSNIFKIIIFSALFIIIMPLFRYDFSYKNFSNVFFQFNHYGYYLMISTMLAGFMFVHNTKIKKIIYLLMYIFLIYILILNDTFGCYLAISISLTFSFIYSIIKKYKRVDIIILIVTFVAASFLISHFDIKIGERIKVGNTQGIVSNNISTFSSDVKKIISKDENSNTDRVGTGRGKLWKWAWKYTVNHPIIGGGMESLNSYYKDNNVKSDRPHNIMLQVSSFIGIPGAILYLSLILYLAIVNLKNINKNTINYMVYVTAMCYYISSNFGNSMFYTSPYFMILLGFLISMYSSVSKLENSKKA